MAPLPPSEPLVLSPTKVTTYLQCPRKYRFRYVEHREPEFRSVHLAFGAAVHSAIAFWHEERLAGRDPPMDRVLRTFRADWEAQKTQGVRPEELVDQAELVAKGAALVQLFCEDFEDFKGERVVAVEQGFEVDLADPATEEVVPGVRLRGYLDLVLADGTIVEVKTAAKMPSAAAVRQQLQGTAYALAYGVGHDPPPKLLYVYLLKTKQPALKRMPTERTVAEQSWFVGLAREVAGAIRAEAFPPIPGWQCGGCEYRRACGGRNQHDQSQQDRAAQSL